jgi:diguanylate cyclase (GGDEF)-like protein/putative nucleotidyltransferase with HDIG domain
VESSPHRRPRLDHLRGLLSVVEAVRAGGDLRPVLEAVAATVADALGFRTVAVNLHRPAWDDFEVVVVHGTPEAREVLLGEVTRLGDWSPVLDERFEAHGTYLIPAGEFDWNDDRVAAYVPRPSGATGPGAWDPEDALLIPLTAGDGTLLGVVSVDEPSSGMRPTDADLEVLGATAAYAAVAIEHARAVAEGEAHRAAVEHLLRVSAQLTGRGTVEATLGAVCAGIRDALGFQRVNVLLAEEGSGDLVVGASVGTVTEGLPARMPLAWFGGLLEPGLAEEGCVLLPEADAVARVAPPLRRARLACPRGRGPLAWDGHWLLVPLQDREGRVAGFVSVDEPADRLLPTTARLRTLRAFANQAVAALESARQLVDLRHLAGHDPLTGLRNRRDFEPRLERSLAVADAERPVALLIGDVDHFKRVNDSLGHQAGDEVLRRMAGVLREHTRPGDLPTRLGGEEFAIVLEGASLPVALAVAERLRRGVRAEFAGFDRPISLSVGVAAGDGASGTTAGGLVRNATRALHAAKRLGRDRCLAHDAQTLEMLDALHDGDVGDAREQLAAAILLAETLDLRDLGTSRHSQTVGRYAEQIARNLRLGPLRVARLRAAGVLHDIGKLGISDAVLHKPGPLAGDEVTEIRRHPELGASILEHANLRDIAGWVLAHHERVDGHGYPSGLRGDEIPLEARVLAVADAYEAMTAERPYRSALPREEAVAELRRGAGEQFDGAVVRAFLGVLEPTAAAA